MQLRVRGPNRGSLIYIQNLSGWLLSLKSLDFEAHLQFNDKQHHMGLPEEARSLEGPGASITRASGRYARATYLEPISNAQLASKLAAGWDGFWANGNPYTVPGRNILEQFSESEYFKEIKSDILDEVRVEIAKDLRGVSRTQYTVSARQSSEALRQDIQDILERQLPRLVEACKRFVLHGGVQPENSTWWSEQKGNLPAGYYEGDLIESLEYWIDTVTYGHIEDNKVVEDYE